MDFCEIRNWVSSNLTGTDRQTIQTGKKGIDFFFHFTAILCLFSIYIKPSVVCIGKRKKKVDRNLQMSREHTLEEKKQKSEIHLLPPPRPPPPPLYLIRCLPKWFCVECGDTFRLMHFHTYTTIAV